MAMWVLVIYLSNVCKTNIGTAYFDKIQFLIYNIIKGKNKIININRSIIHDWSYLKFTAVCCMQ